MFFRKEGRVHLLSEETERKENRRAEAVVSQRASCAPFLHQGMFNCLALFRLSPVLHTLYLPEWDSRGKRADCGFDVSFLLKGRP